jgi:hypothetical protein
VCLDHSKIHSSCGRKFGSNACIVNLSRICSASKSEFKIHIGWSVCWNWSYELPTEGWVHWRHLSYTKFLARPWQNFAKSLIYTGKSILPRNPDSVTGRVPGIRTSQIANHFGLFDGPLESWEGCLPFGIQNFQNFSWPKTQKLRSVLPLFCPESEFSSNVDR